MSRAAAPIPENMVLDIDTAIGAESVGGNKKIVLWDATLETLRTVSKWLSLLEARVSQLEREAIEAKAAGSASTIKQYSLRLLGRLDRLKKSFSDRKRAAVIPPSYALAEHYFRERTPAAI